MKVVVHLLHTFSASWECKQTALDSLATKPWHQGLPSRPKTLGKRSSEMLRRFNCVTLAVSIACRGLCLESAESACNDSLSMRGPPIGLQRRAASAIRMPQGTTAARCTKVPVRALDPASTSTAETPTSKQERWESMSDQEREEKFHQAFAKAYTMSQL